MTIQIYPINYQYDTGFIRLILNCKTAVIFYKPRHINHRHGLHFSQTNALSGYFSTGSWLVAPGYNYKYKLNQADMAGFKKCHLSLEFPR